MNPGRVLALNSGEEWALQIEMGEMAICLLSLNVFANADVGT